MEEGCHVVMEDRSFFHELKAILLWAKVGKILTPHGPHSMECDAVYLHSGLSQHAYLTKGLIISRKWEAELPRMVIENRNVYKFKFAWFPTFLPKISFN